MFKRVLHFVFLEDVPTYGGRNAHEQVKKKRQTFAHRRTDETREVEIAL